MSLEELRMSFGDSSIGVVSIEIDSVEIWTYIER